MSHHAQRRRFEHGGSGTPGGAGRGVEGWCPICGRQPYHRRCSSSAYRRIDISHAREANLGECAFADELRRPEPERLGVGLKILFPRAEYDWFEPFDPNTRSEHP